MPKKYFQYSLLDGYPKLCHKDLMEHLRILNGKWLDIGKELGISEKRLRHITSDIAHGRLSHVFKEWEANPTQYKPYTWETVMDMLSSQRINSYYLAVQIDEKLLHK